MAVEHNFEEPKRSEIEGIMNRHNDTRVHTWRQDDFYAPADRNSLRLAGRPRWIAGKKKAALGVQQPVLT